MTKKFLLLTLGLLLGLAGALPAQLPILRNEFTTNTTAGLRAALAATVKDYGGDVTNYATASAPGAEWTFYPMSWPATNFVVTGGDASSTPTGPSSAYYVTTNEQSGIVGPGVVPASTPAVSFGVDGNEFYIRSYGVGNYYNLVVDGVNVLRTGFLAASENYLRVQFSTSKRRVVKVLAPWNFAGIYVAKTNGVWLPQAPVKTLLVLGDSYIQQGPGFDSQRFNAIIDCLQQDLGPAWNVLGYGQSGTGWFAPGSAGYTNFLGRIEDVFRVNPDALLNYGGVNDAGYCTNTSQTNIVFNYATNFLQTVRARLPQLPIINIGPQVYSASYAATIYPQNATALLRDASLTISNCWYYSPWEENWITGEQATPGSGNATRYIASDNLHPTSDGHAYLAKRILGRARPILDRVLGTVQASGFIATNQPPEVYAIKLASSPALTSDATLNADPDLIISNVLAGRTYILRGELLGTAATATPGFQYSIKIPNSSFATIKLWKISNAFGYPTQFYGFAGGWDQTGALAIDSFTTGAATPYTFTFECIFTPAVNGECRIFWCQSTSSADNTFLREGSYMSLKQIK